MLVAIEKNIFFFHNFRLHSSSSRLRTAFFFDDSKLLRQLECKRKNSSTKFNRWAQQLCIQCTDIFHIFHLMAIFYIHKMKYILFVPMLHAWMSVCAFDIHFNGALCYFSFVRLWTVVAFFENVGDRSWCDHLNVWEIKTKSFDHQHHQPNVLSQATINRDDWRDDQNRQRIPMKMHQNRITESNKKRNIKKATVLFIQTVKIDVQTTCCTWF